MPTELSFWEQQERKEAERAGSIRSPVKNPPPPPPPPGGHSAKKSPPPPPQQQPRKQSLRDSIAAAKRQKAQKDAASTGSRSPRKSSNADVDSDSGPADFLSELNQGKNSLRKSGRRRPQQPNNGGAGPSKPSKPSWQQTPYPANLQQADRYARASEPSSGDDRLSLRPDTSRVRSYKRGPTTPQQRVLDDSDVPSPGGFVAEEGSHVWLLKDSTDAWRPCVVVIAGGRGRDEEATVKDVETGEETMTATKWLKKRDQSSLRDCDNMVNIGDLNEPSMLHNLRQRYAVDQIYTNIGPILLSVNPFKTLGIYGQREKRQYSCPGELLKDQRPHVFGVAAAAWNALKDSHVLQSIIISGESGAGKTEATKLVLEFLATAAMTASSGSSIGVHEQLIASSPIIEAFGNAKTTRNDNSSRFGKYMEVQIDSNGAIVGGKITKYLLEKSRIVKQADGERNYHIFAMIFYLNETARRELPSCFNLGVVANFEYMDGQRNNGAGQHDSAEQFREVQTALAKFGVSNDIESSRNRENHDMAPVQLDIWRVVGATLWLGNIEFIDGRDYDSSELSAVGKDAIERAATLLEVDRDELLQCCIQKRREAHSEVVITPLVPAAASDARNAVAKELYSRLFDWVFKKVNQELKAPPSSDNRHIGVLDIFGFESFESNSFEQLCINFANEKLQLHFNRFFFERERQAYREEGLSALADIIAFQDNSGCIDLIERKERGILSVIDDEIDMQGTAKSSNYSDESLLEQLNQQCGSDPFYSVSRPQARPGFVIRHYASEVGYEIEGFLEKNKDAVQPEILDLLGTSTQPLVRTLFQKADNGRECAQQSPRRSVLSKSKGRRATLGSKFKTSLAELYAELDKTQPHFIKCIKPNDRKENAFDSQYTLTQLKYLGLVEVTTIRRSGYPVHKSYREMIGRYRCILEPMRRSHQGDRDRDVVQKVLEAADTEYQQRAASISTKKQSKSSWKSRSVAKEKKSRTPASADSMPMYQLGKSIVFLKDEINYVLEDLRHSKRTQYARVLQRIRRERMQLKKEKQSAQARRNGDVAAALTAGGVGAAATVLTDNLCATDSILRTPARFMAMSPPLQRRRWTLLFRAMRLACVVLSAWWICIVAGFCTHIVQTVFVVLSSFPIAYWLARVIRHFALWQKRPTKSASRGYYVVKPPLFVDPPLLILVTLVVMHLTWRLAHLGAQYDSEEQASLRPAPLHPPPNFFEQLDPSLATNRKEVAGIVASESSGSGAILITEVINMLQRTTISAIIVLVSVVAIPNVIAQEQWLFREQWQGEMLQYSAYTLGGLGAAGVSCLSWLWTNYSSGQWCLSGYTCWDSTTITEGVVPVPSHLMPTPLLQRILDQ